LNNKYLARTYANDNSFFFEIDPTLTDDENIKKVPSYPFMAKPCFAAFGVWQKIVRCDQDFREYLKFCRDSKLLTFQQSINAYIMTHMEAEDLPMGLTTPPCFLGEELIEGYREVYCDGWADANGQIHTWFICDLNLYPGSFLMDCLQFPTSLSPDLVTLAEKCMKQYMRGLPGKGYRSDFFMI